MAQAVYLYIKELPPHFPNHATILLASSNPTFHQTSAYSTKSSLQVHTFKRKKNAEHITNDWIVDIQLWLQSWMLTRYRTIHENTW